MPYMLCQFILGKRVFNFKSLPFKVSIWRIRQVSHN